MERRRSRRVSLMAEIDYQLDGVVITKRIADLSVGGAFIDTPVPAPIGTSFRLRFSLEGSAIEADGRVVYSQPYIGMGVEFTRVSDEGQEAIRGFVARAATELQPV